jgi:hypothetical protein
MIVSASRRTDIPAFYAEWFMNRIREGFVLFLNPFRPSQTGRLDLDPVRVDGIVFWTRNAAPLFPYLPDLESMGFRYYFQYTVVHYPRAFEPTPVLFDRKIDRFRQLSERIGAERVIWRYDPIILSNLTGLTYHVDHFERIAKALKGHTHRCVISFLNIYRKTEKAFDRLRRERNISVGDLYQEDEIRNLADAFSQTGSACGFDMFTCAERIDLEDHGISHGKCIDDSLLNRLFGLNLSPPEDRGQRKECRCVESTDIGAYDTCPSGCIYCYANRTPELAQRNLRRHNRHSPVLG